MQVANRKTCDGIETYLLIETVWIRLADLPAVLRMMPARRRNEVLQELQESGLVMNRNRGLVVGNRTQANRGLEEKRSRTWSPAEPVTA